MRELNILFSSILYFTRLSLPFKVEYRKENQQLALTWFPLVGAIVGGLAALVFWLMSLYLPHTVAVIVSLGASVLVTGAFHEDGFADVCDAFGGGYSKDQRLKIMKDSRVGAYALIGVVILFALKIALLIEIQPLWIPVILITSHVLSRWSTLIISMGWNYARPTEESKSRDTSHPISWVRFFGATGLGLLPFLLFDSWWVLVTIPVVTLFSWLAGSWFQKRIGGYTGDCLGSVQQVNEVLVMASLLLVIGH
ncbi:adenosylcobinamide-GDP ribazoletransferase [Marinilabilia rubra]|uniref:Adenosylcobinamide-GDP ribazoletransferase n=1 Tax=Marinilabilia rubra TaxID=2162893 RepID=A0A2U2B5T2_9BACT|nr:adenosylcobinamide-GDP ribazoletransferase [Marinilabilia rubra]PWD98415.1 adenosylcobinamide-GDP ribazoletransferase [Marinilabilia rubra]